MEGGRGLGVTLKLCVNRVISCDLNLPTSELVYFTWLKQKWNPVEKGAVAFQKTL